ncbi:MAG: dynamin family protein [Acutalibacteraceae bacterium]|nr:dynamin family protein [Acutalibacteraceae bacterium]
MSSDYNARKNEVIASYEQLEELVSELQSYAKKIDLPDPMERLGTLLSDIRGKAERVKADRFNIIIAGESKSGKSTFINAYLGVELLPMDVKQCTSAIVEIKYGRQFAVKATYAEGGFDKIEDEEKARAFLKKNAALDDDYRDIPVPTINSEILVKAGLRAKDKGTQPVVYKAEVEAMLNSPEVKAANIHNIPDYNDRIRSYIKARINTWGDIVTKIEVTFPFGDELRGIEIIDSPGVCARGGVSEITSQYIENADAIIFLKPVIGQSLESEQFNQFMENVSVARNKNALFLVLTHIATKNEADIRRLEEEAYKQFSAKLEKHSILFVDSKAELFAKQFAGIEDIQSELRRLNSEGKLDDFVIKAYTETNGLFGDGDNNDFINKLHEKSRFDSIYQALNTFGRKAHYILLAALLDSISTMYSKLWNDMNSRIDMFKQKAEDPTELAKKIAMVKQELEVLQNKMYKGVSNVTRRFQGEEGLIATEAKEAVADFLSSVGEISPDAQNAFDRLESISLGKIDYFKELQERLQKQVVAEFDKELIALSDKSTIPYESLKPDFTEETFKEIKESTKEKATETRSYETGITFKKTHTYSKYVQNKHFVYIKDDIVKRLGGIKDALTSNLWGFVENISARYIAELSQNADAKKAELDAIMEAKATAEQIQSIIQRLAEMSKEIETHRLTVKKIKGGINRNV